MASCDLPRATVLAFVIALLVGGCEMVGLEPVATGNDVPHAYPAGCSVFKLSARRCQAIVAWALDAEGLTAADVRSVDLLGDPGCGGDPRVLCTRTMSFVVRVRLNRAGGDFVEQSVFCGVGGQYRILCTEAPEIRISGTTLEGYRDVPCSNANGQGCATPLPSFEPKARAAARPLRVPSLDIRIDHLGHYVVDVGHAVLPNGVLSHAALGLADPRTQAVLIEPDNGLQLDVQSINPRAPAFDNYYRRGWHRGTEEVVVRLDFEVTAFSPGAVLQVRDLVVE